MVYPKLLKRDDLWVLIAQVLIGSFFVSAAYFKIGNYFFPGDQSLHGHMQYWLNNEWPVSWLRPIMIHVFQPLHKPIAVLVILGQSIPGLMIMMHYRTRLAALLLLPLQLLIFLATFNQTNFNEFVGISLWICLFYLLLPKKKEDVSLFIWNCLTITLTFLLALQASNRYRFYFDNEISTFAFRQQHLASDVMSVHPVWKDFALWLMNIPYAEYVWASGWYFHILLVILMLTRWRLQSALINLLLFLYASLTWMNGTTSQGVLWVLTLFIYVTFEQYLQYKKPELRKKSLLSIIYPECKKIITASWH